jgi:beta-galactosidase
MKRTLGTCYYPEQWPKSMWQEDAKRMADAGLTWVRIGEFSWGVIEPEPYQLNWQWLDEAIETLSAAGLKIILGTPTATPPRWMLDKHPQMLATDAQGQVRKFGSRRHYCFSHQPYRDECARICTLMAERYAKHPQVLAWQIDNEYSCHDTTLSYSEASLTAFRVWLQRKYQTIEQLNQRWGNVFWSMQYNRFDQIALPNSCVTEPNPSHVLDFQRFSSHQVVTFNQLQANILRQHTQAPLIHNYMGRITDFDHFAVGKDLDIASWDSYPLGFLEDRLVSSEAHKQLFSQQGDPDFQAFHHDLYRSVGNDRLWIMEQQPGPVNWAPFNPAPLPGMVRLWSWEAFAHGAETVCYFRWRQAPFAQEQMHAGLFYPDDTPAPGLDEVQQVAAEIAQLPQCDIAAANVAIVFDYNSQWAWQTQPQGANFDYFTLVLTYYKALRSLGLSIDIISTEQQSLNAYKLVIIPGLMHFNDTLNNALQQFTGTLLAGPRSGSKTSDFAINTQAIMPSINSRIKHVQSLRPQVKIPLGAGGNAEQWLETTSEEDPILERCENGRAIRIGQQKCQYLCAWLDHQALVRLLGSLCDQENISTEKLPEGVRIRDSKQHRFTFNYNAQNVEYKGISLEPAAVHWQTL